MRFEILIPRQSFQELDRLLANVSATAVHAGRVSMLRLAKNYRAEVEKRYVSGVSPALSKGALEKRQQGKRRGRTPRLRKYAGTKPLFRSGRLARLVLLKQKFAGARRSYEASVYIKPRIRMSGGGLSEKVAAVNEFGGTWHVPIPPWARAYLRALMLGVAGSNTRVNVGGDHWLISTITIPARPVWMPALAELMARQPSEFVSIFGKEFNRGLRKFTINGKPLQATFT